MQAKPHPRKHLLIAVSFGAAGFSWGADPSFATELAVPVYEEVAERANLHHSYRGGWEFSVGGGGAAFDCNDDGKADLFLAGGEGPSRLFLNASNEDGAIAFDEAEKGALPDALTDVTGAYPLDIDGDGQVDLAIPRVGPNLLLRGDGQCRFSIANQRWNFDGGDAWSTAFTAAWEKGARFPTLVFGNYVDRSIHGGSDNRCHDNELYRPAETSTAMLDYSEKRLLSPSHCTLSIMFTDWNNSGDLAFRVSNDRQYYRERGEEQLWSFRPGRDPVLFGRDDGWEALQIWGMGIAAADLDGDLMPEYAITSMADNKLQTLYGDAPGEKPTYTDIALKSQTLAHRPYVGENALPSTAWHAEFADLNNDGIKDLFFAKGNVEDMPNFAAFDPDNLLLGRPDGTFEEVGDRAGIAIDRPGRGAVFADFNRDGMLDIVVVNRRAPVSVFEHQKNASGGPAMGNWARIDLRGKGGNRNAIGAKVLVTGDDGRKQSHVIAIGGGHTSDELVPVLIGLGEAMGADLSIIWPDGERSGSYRIAAGTLTMIAEGRDGAIVKAVK